MAKFKFVPWLFDFLLSTIMFSFDWDEGNATKNLIKHGVECGIIESVFYDNEILALGKQYEPDFLEPRFAIIGKAIDGKIYFVCFTIRQSKIRPISARIANWSERIIYEQEIC